MRGPEVVSASEVAAYAWCPESWRLDATGAAPSNQAALARGEQAHVRNATVEVESRSATSLGWWLILAATALLTGLAVWWFRGSP